MPRGHGIKTRTGFILRDWLRARKEGTVTEFYEYLSSDSDLKKYDIGTFHTVNTLFWVLRSKLELIMVVRTGTSAKRGHRPINIYAVRKGYERDMAWDDIYKFAYPDDYTENQDQLTYWKMRKALNKSITRSMFDREGGKYA